MNIKTKLILCLIVLLIIICSILINNNIKLIDKLDVTEQELLNTRKSVNALTNKNKDMKETNLSLNLELSIANEKITNMQNTGIPIYFTEEEVNYIAKTVYGEARGCSKIQQSAVVWCILNRLDNGYWGNTIKSVVTAQGQFHGYSSSFPVADDIKELVEDVLFRWNMEKSGATNIGRTLPERFMFFHADGSGTKNCFTTSAGRGEVWDFDCWNPYE